MKKVISLLLIAWVCFSCKKNEAGNNAQSADTAFQTFMQLSDFSPGGQMVRGQVYHPASGNLYFYLPGTAGYSIIQLNTQTKQSVIVYTTANANWSITNGAAGRRLRIDGNALYVMGGTNMLFQRLSGIGNNSLTLSQTYVMPASPAPGWGEPYDIAVADKMYVMTMRDKITLGSLNNFLNVGSFPVPYTSHDASLIYASKDGTPYLVSRNGGEPKIEVRNPSNGNFIRGVTTFNSTGCLVKDSKDRIYVIDGRRVLRFSADLLNKEEFKSTNAYGGEQISLAEDGNNVILYVLDNPELRRMRLPQ